jgi:hypothetical protein
MLPACRCIFLFVAAGALGAAAEASGAGGGLRELTTDRPDTTETPFTVDRGHVQLEMDVARYSQAKRDGGRTREWELAPFNIRYGVAADVEVGIFISPYLEVTAEPRNGAKVKTEGRGDTTLRLKKNFWGNDGGKTGFGVIADVKVPTATHGLGNDQVDAALTLPYGRDLGAGWDLAAMTTVVWAQTDFGRRLLWQNSLSIYHEFVPDLGGFVELASSAGESRHVLVFNCGVTRLLSPTLQLDCGVNIGLTSTAPDLGVFAGFARKF